MFQRILFVVLLSCMATFSYSQICEGSLTVTIEGSTSGTPLGVTADVVQPDCNGESGELTGSITLTVTGGTPDYSYVWTDGPTTKDRTGLGEGIYVVVVTDSKNCKSTSTFSITEPPAIILSGIPTDLECHSDSGLPTGAIDITAEGGTGDLSYAWTGPAGATNLVADGIDQTGLIAGEYTVVVSDENDCSETLTWTLDEPGAVIVFGIETDLNCHQANGPATGAIDLFVSGGQGNTDDDYTYDWETDDGFGLDEDFHDQTELTSGTYNVTVSDANGCTGTATFTLDQPTIISITAQETDLDCNSASGDPEGAIDIEVEGGQGTVESDYDYEWTGPSGATNLVEDAADQTGLIAGTYNLLVTDSNGCTQTATYTLDEPSAVTVSGEIVDLDCNSASGDPTGAITLTVGGGQGSGPGDYNYAWTGPAGATNLVADAQNQTGLIAGSYTVVVSDANGCEATATFDLDEPTPVACTLDAIVQGVGGTHILCEGDSTIITVNASGGSGPYTYSDDGGATTQTENTFLLPAGTHTITVIDANGCTSTCEYTLTEPEGLIAGTCVTEDECQLGLGEIEVAAEGGVAPYTVTWTSTDGTLNEVSQEIATSGGSVTFSGAEGGATYIFTVEDSNGCIIGG